jgi:hypothetical protein
MVWCPQYPLWCGVLNIPYGMASFNSLTVWYPQYTLIDGLKSQFFIYGGVSSINPHRGLDILRHHSLAPGAWLLFCVGATMQESVGALVSTKVWEISYLHVQFILVFTPYLLFTCSHFPKNEGECWVWRPSDHYRESALVLSFVCCAG